MELRQEMEGRWFRSGLGVRGEGREGGKRVGKGREEKHTDLEWKKKK